MAQPRPILAEEDNYIRLFLLLFVNSICRRAVQIFFDSKFQSGLDASLKKEQNKLLDLKLNHRINQEQWNLLFPGLSDMPDSNTFDITLMITLIRELTDIAPSSVGYYSLPTPIETTPAADLARINYFRNYGNYMAHCNKYISNTEFNKVWDIISGAIHRLGGQAMKQECDQLKVETLDETQRSSVLENIKSLKFATEMAENDKLQLLERISSANEFKTILSKGTYASFENRVYLAGSVKTGKSTLASVLIGEKVPTDWKSTDGLIIHFGKNGIDLMERKMIPLKKGSAGHDVFAKLVRGKLQLKKQMQPEASFSSNSSYVETEESCTAVDQTEKITKSEKIELELSIQEKMCQEILQGNYKMDIAPSDLVDFGGQKSYDMTHQLFIQCKGTFVLMFDGRYGLYDDLVEYKPKKITTISILKHWIDSILTYCVDEFVDEHKQPKILFAATNGDAYPLQVDVRLLQPIINETAAHHTIQPHAKVTQ